MGHSRRAAAVAGVRAPHSQPPVSAGLSACNRRAEHAGRRVRVRDPARSQAGKGHLPSTFAITRASQGACAGPGNPPAASLIASTAGERETRWACRARQGPSRALYAAATVLLVVMAAFTLVGCVGAQPLAKPAGTSGEAGSDQPHAALVSDCIPVKTWAASGADGLPTAEALAQGIEARGLAPAEPAADDEVAQAASLSSQLQGEPQAEMPHIHYVWDDANGVRWRVFSNAGNFYAAPLSYAGAPLDVDCILSENGGVVEYLPEQDEFVEFAGERIEGGTEIVKVDAIDASTLQAWGEQNLLADEAGADEEDGPDEAGGARAAEEDGSDEAGRAHTAEDDGIVPVVERKAAPAAAAEPDAPGH